LKNWIYLQDLWSQSWGFIKGKYLLILGCVILILLVTGVFLTPILRNNKIEYQFNLGTKYLEAGEFTQALHAFDKVTEKDSSRVDAMLGKAKSLIGLNRLAEAETLLLEIINSEPTFSEAYVQLVQIYIQNRDIAGALDMVSRGEDATGRYDLFLDQVQELDSNISITAELQELRVGQGTSIGLLYSFDGEQLVLAPDWSVDDNTTRLEQKSDGFIEVSTDIAGEIMITAVIGPISRELTLTFISMAEISTRITDLDDFVRKSSHFFAIPVFSDPNELNNEILILYLFNWIMRANQDVWDATAEEMEQAARDIFGPNIKALAHESSNWVEWDPQTQRYEVIPLGLGYSFMTHIVLPDTVNGYFVDAVHLSGEICDENDEIEVYDEDGNLVGTYSFEELDDVDVFHQEMLSKLPKRRYVFTMRDDGGFYLIQSKLVR